MHGVLLSVQVGELLLLDDLGDRAGGASVLASATGDAGLILSDVCGDQEAPTARGGAAVSAGQLTRRANKEGERTRCRASGQ